MSSDKAVSLLIDQLALATGRARGAKAEGKDAEAIDSVVRSLRLTLACVLQSRDLRKTGAEGFACVTDHMIDPLVRHKGKSLPVNGAYLESLFREAGVVLSPGQVILLDAALARNLCETALSLNGFQEAMIRQEKRVLTAAYLAADRMEHGLPPLVDGVSTEAA